LSPGVQQAVQLAIKGFGFSRGHDERDIGQVAAALEEGQREHKPTCVAVAYLHVGSAYNPPVTCVVRRVTCRHDA
jgi:hypothetical protein